MKAYWGVDVQIHIFLTSALAGGECSPSRPGRFTPGETAPGTHWIGDWVDPRPGLDDMEKRLFLTLPGIETRPLGRPARRQSLYRVRYTSRNKILNKYIDISENINKYLNSKRFWQWSVTLGITEFLDFAHRPVFYKKHYRTQRFGNRMCFRPQVRGGGRQLLCCVRQKELTSIILILADGQPWDIDIRRWPDQDNSAGSGSRAFCWETVTLPGSVFHWLRKLSHSIRCSQRSWVHQRPAYNNGIHTLRFNSLTFRDLSDYNLLYLLFI
jgi:hypothetical protein